MSLLEETKSLLRKHRIIPNKHLGQNFLVDSTIFQSLGDYASISKHDVVLDVGAGLGFLTRFLAKRCRNVLTVEIDSRLATVLSEQLTGLTNVHMIWGNVLKAVIPSFNKVISVPPYHISSRLLSWLFRKDFTCAVMILQKEFASRLVAPAGTHEYGWLSVLSRYCSEIELLEMIPNSAFYPQPNVESVTVRVSPRKTPPFKLENEELFRMVAQSLFTQRNKKVRNAIVSFIMSTRSAAKEDAQKMAAILPFREKRVRDLLPEEFGALANAFAD